jgi:hypothetical protein
MAGSSAACFPEGGSPSIVLRFLQTWWMRTSRNSVPNRDQTRLAGAKSAENTRTKYEDYVKKFVNPEPRTPSGYDV